MKIQDAIIRKHAQRSYRNLVTSAARLDQAGDKDAAATLQSNADKLLERLVK